MDFNHNTNGNTDEQIYSDKYQIYGQWEEADGGHNLVFHYQDETVRIFTSAEFNDKTARWLDALAVIKIEDYVEQKQFEEFFSGK